MHQNFQNQFSFLQLFQGTTFPRVNTDEFEFNESNSDDGFKKYERTFVWKGIHIFKFFFEKAKKGSARMPKWYWN